MTEAKTAQLPVERLKLSEVSPHPDNPRHHSRSQIEAIADSVRVHRYAKGSMVVQKSSMCLVAGHGVYNALTLLEYEEADFIVMDMDDNEAMQFLIQDNRLNDMSSWDMSVLSANLAELQEAGYTLEDMAFDMESMDELEAAEITRETNALYTESEDQEEAHTTLAEKFIVPPFSVLDARQGYWQDRKRAWIKLGIKSELGRGDNDNSDGLLGESQQARSHYKGGTLGAIASNQATEVLPDYAKKAPATSYSSQDRLAALQRTGDSRAVSVINSAFGRPEDAVPASSQTGTSIFDPVLCELVYRWFCPDDGTVLDPFAGGSVRGIVAEKLGYRYTGIDLRPEQIESNEEQAAALNVKPVWIEGDSCNIPDLTDSKYDLIFSCPPYYDLELYSDDPNDLSNAEDYDAFLEAYRLIIKQSIDQLKDNRFACFVVGDIRDKKGLYRNFVSDTIAAFHAAGARLYNEAILITVAGSLPVRSARPFISGRKLGKTHQNVLIFYKGDPSKIRDIYSADIDVEFPGDEAIADLTPVERNNGYYLKRDDLYSIAGVCGGKVRTCWHLSQGADGLVTAGSRQSPQVNIVAQIAKYLDVPCRVHTPQGELSPEVKDAQAAGAEVIQHKAGYNNVIIARAREDAADRCWTEIPFGMECQEAIEQTRKQVANVPAEVKRIVMPVGSGMSLAGVLWGLHDNGYDIPVVGVQVGADPSKRLDKYAPPNWREIATLVETDTDYHQEAEQVDFHGIQLDPIYEAKAAPYVESDDLFWIVGIRRTAMPVVNEARC